MLLAPVTVEPEKILRENPVIDARQECLDYVVSPLDVDALAARFPGVRLSRVPGPASTSLTRIEAGGPLPAHCATREAAAPTRG